MLGLYEEFCKIIPDKGILRLLWQSLKRVVTQGGLYWEVERGIPLGSPLSPLLGAVALLHLNKACTRAGLFYARFMDDWVVLTKTKQQLRKAVKITHEVLKKLKMKMHPLKTFIGRIEKGFDFLGFHLNGKTIFTNHRTIC